MQIAKEEASQKFPKLPVNTLVRRLQVAGDIFSKKRVPYTKLAEKYEVSRRTIYTDVEWIRSNFNIELIQKAVQDKVAIALEEVVNPIVILKYGLPFLAKGLTQKTEIQGELSQKVAIIVKKWTPENEPAN
jgi:predicted regulator of amino acid metabolism with ACT domain